MAHLHFCQHTKPNNKCKRTTKAAQSGRTNERILAFLQGGLSEDMNQRIHDMLYLHRDQLSLKISIYGRHWGFYGRLFYYSRGKCRGKKDQTE